MAIRKTIPPSVEASETCKAKEGNNIPEGGVVRMNLKLFVGDGDVLAGLRHVVGVTTQS